MHDICRFSVFWNVIIDWISMSTDIVPKNIWLADIVYNFDWNSAEPQKFWWRHSACHKISALWRMVAAQGLA